jgi:hypothetical protein
MRKAADDGRDARGWSYKGSRSAAWLKISLSTSLFAGDLRLSTNDLQDDRRRVCIVANATARYKRLVAE